MGQYDQMSGHELKDELEHRRLPKTGTKPEMVARLEEDDAAKGGQSDPDDPQPVDEGVDDEEGTDAEDDEEVTGDPDSASEQRAANRDRGRGARGTVEGEDGRPVGPDGRQPRTTDEEIAARTADESATSATRYTKVYVIQARDYREGQPHEDMHNANKAALLELALHAGLHPKGRPELDGTEELPDGSVALSYSVDVVPASEDEDVAGTQTPSAEINDMGGSTTQGEPAHSGSGTKQ